MAMSAEGIFDKVHEELGKGNIDFVNDTFKMLLVDSGWTPSETHDLADITTHELSGNGYARKALTNQTWARSGAVSTFDSDPPVQTASGGSIVARYWVIYDDTHASDQPICYGLCDDTPADITIADGASATFNPHATNGWAQFQDQT